MRDILPFPFGVTNEYENRTLKDDFAACACRARITFPIRDSHVSEKDDHSAAPEEVLDVARVHQQAEKPEQQQKRTE